MQVLLNSMDKVRNFVDVVTGFESDIDLESGKFVVDAKSILGILSLNIGKPLMVVVHNMEEQNKIYKSLEGFQA